MRQRGPIKDFALGIYDGPHATPAESHEGPVYLGIPNVTTDGRLDLTDIRHISEHEYPKWVRRAIPQKDDLVFSYEATLHRYALIPDDLRCCLGRRMCLVRPNTNKVYPRFLLYYFLSSKWRAVIESNIVVGATVERIPIAKFPDFEVELPPLDVQRRIADILSAYDDLIENNRRRIDLLEQSARMLYKEWFVSLRFPGHEHVKVKDGIPQGWEKKRFGDVVYNFDNMRVPLSILEREQRTGIYPYHGAAGILSYIDEYIFDGRYILIGEDGTVITPAQTPMLQFVEGKFWVSNHAHVVQGKDVSTEFLYYFLSHYPIGGHITGVAQPKITQANLNRIEVLLPAAQVQLLFQEFIEPIVAQVFSLKSQIIKLQQARDLLLPRLMNGEIPV